jgi:hypothetical protein
MTSNELKEIPTGTPKRNASFRNTDPFPNTIIVIGIPGKANRQRDKINAKTSSNFARLNNKHIKTTLNINIK